MPLGKCLFTWSCAASMARCSRSCAVNKTGTLVIACGNPLRGDDGVARVAGERLIALQLTEVRVLTVHQLMPELIEDIKKAARVLFLDAGIDTGDAAFKIRM